MHTAWKVLVIALLAIFLASLEAKAIFEGESKIKTESAQAPSYEEQRD